MEPNLRDYLYQGINLLALLPTVHKNFPHLELVDTLQHYKIYL